MSGYFRLPPQMIKHLCQKSRVSPHFVTPGLDATAHAWVVRFQSVRRVNVSPRAPTVNRAASLPTGTRPTARPRARRAERTGTPRAPGPTQRHSAVSHSLFVLDLFLSLSLMQVSVHFRVSGSSESCLFGSFECHFDLTSGQLG